VEGRFKLYQASMDALLNPDDRTDKITKLSEDIIIDVGPRLWDGEQEDQVIGLQVRIPAGTNAALLGNFQYKAFIVDLVRSKTDRQKLQQHLQTGMNEAEARQLGNELVEVAGLVIADPASLIDIIRERPHLLDSYSSCTADVENDGHDFGGELPDADKQALIAFLATL
jgi:hypothetical protein